MYPESIDYLFETGAKAKQEDYIWPIAGKATTNDKVFVVCDGAGSFHNGGIPSRLICQYMAAGVLKFSEQRMTGEVINRLLNEAKDELIAYAREHRMDTDLATTFSMLILYDQKAFVSWCGDSPVYHLRAGEIIFNSEDHVTGTESIRNTTIAQGIRADNSPIYAEAKWIEDLRDGDYFLLCSRGLTENLTGDDIELLVSQNTQVGADLAGSFRQLAAQKASDNYSMYLVRVNIGTKKKEVSKGFVPVRKQSNGNRTSPFNKQTVGNRTALVSKLSGGNRTPLLILAVTILVLFMMVFFFRKARNSGPAANYENPASRPGNAAHNDTVPSAIVMSAPRKPLPAETPPANPAPALQADPAPATQADELPEPIIETPADDKKAVAQLLLKYRTDEACKLQITNLDQDEVIHWDLDQNDNGTIYLKPGRYTILATSTTDSSKSKTYHFDVKYNYANTRQDLNIKF